MVETARQRLLSHILALPFPAREDFDGWQRFVDARDAAIASLSSLSSLETPWSEAEGALMLQVRAQGDACATALQQAMHALGEKMRQNDKVLGQRRAHDDNAASTFRARI